MAEDTNALKVQPSDNPGLVLVTTLLDGTNFLSWSRSIKLGLRTKMKLSFISADIKKPEENTKEMEQWDRTDSMVTSWILNSISREIVESFMYTNSARELWVELENRFEQSNGPLEYRLKKELGALTQGSLTLSNYFGKLKKLWDELACITYTPKCTCGAAKETSEIEEHDQTIQFLMGLNDVYDHAYKKPEFQKSLQKNRNLQDKRQLICKECGKSGHLKEACFEIHGYPEWYKALMEQRKWNASTTNKAVATIEMKGTGHLKEACFEIHGYPEWYKALMEQRKWNASTTNKAVTTIEMKGTGNNAVDEQTIARMFRNVFHKFLGGLKPQISHLKDEDKYDFSGITSEPKSFNTEMFDAWIIDIGTTSHMSTRLKKSLQWPA
ncbi:UNVERIFIED_CONTAM: hypothetical protein Sindi_1644600 [Sesamum indicum]